MLLKTSSDGSAEPHKHGLDNDETFSSVILLESLQTVIALAVHTLLQVVHVHLWEVKLSQYFVTIYVPIRIGIIH